MGGHHNFGICVPEQMDEIVRGLLKRSNSFCWIAKRVLDRVCFLFLAESLSNFESDMMQMRLTKNARHTCTDE